MSALISFKQQLRYHCRRPHTPYTDRFRFVLKSKCFPTIWNKLLLIQLTVFCFRVFWLKTQLNRLFWTVPEYSMSLCAPLGFCSRQPLMPCLCHLVHRGVAKWLQKSGKRAYFFLQSGFDSCFFPLWCNSAIVLFVYTLFSPFLQSTHSLTCVKWGHHIILHGRGW